MEVDTLGYKVQKRAARSDEWVTVASYEDWAPLNSQGENGGTYTLLDPDTELGDWIYRVIDVEASGRNTILCQVLVEVQNKGEVILQYVERSVSRCSSAASRPTPLSSTQFSK
jgi:hypothetical protein